MCAKLHLPLYCCSPMIDALECKPNVLCPINSSVALRGPSTCSEPVGFVDWECYKYIYIQRV